MVSRFAIDGLVAMVSAGGTFALAFPQFRPTRQDLMIAAIAALLAGLLGSSFSMAVGGGLIVALAIIDARSELVPFRAALPGLGFLAVATSYERGPFFALVGLAIAACAVTIVFVGKERPRLAWIAMAGYAFASIGASQRWLPALVVGIGACAALMVVEWRMGGERKFAGGDIVLAAIVGCFLGWSWGSLALLLGVAVALTIWLTLVRQQGRSLRFGPSLAIGTLIVFCCLHIVPVR